MSLLENIKQKRAAKIQLEQEKKVQEKKQSLDQITNNITALQEKKQRIKDLSGSLRENYKTGAEKATDFKNQKDTLKKVYENNQDLFEDEGITNFEGMLEAKAQAKEVKKLRATGGRGSAKRPLTDEERAEVGRVESDSVRITTDAAGDTGELYKKVETIQQISASLREEMGIKNKKDLNFSATKINKGEEGEMSNREANFIQIEEYLKNLDKELIELEAAKKTAYLETPEGKREALFKIDNPEYQVKPVDFNNITHFYFKSETLELSEKIGAEPIKEVYTEALSKRLTEIAWENKHQYDHRNPDAEGEEQRAIKAYPALKKIDELSYDRTDLKKFNELYTETLNHLEKILQENEKTVNWLTNYGLSISRGRNNETEKRRNEGWSDERILANNYIGHIEELVEGLGHHGDLIEILAKNKDVSRGNIYSSEYVHAKFERYNKFLEYIKNNTDSSTEFLRDRSSSQGTDLLSRVGYNKELRQEIGLNEKLPQQYLELPSEFISRSGGFDTALNKARNASETWEADKKQIAEISKAAVELKFAQEWERYFSQKNKGFLEDINYNENLIKQIEQALNFIRTSDLLKDPDFAKREIKLYRNTSGYQENRIIEDVSAEGSYEIRKEGNKIDEEIKIYADNRKNKIETEQLRLKNAMWINRLSEKLENLRVQLDTFNHFAKGIKIEEANALKYGVTPEEIAVMKEYRKRKTENEEAYTKFTGISTKFAGATSKSNIYIDFKAGKDILDGQRMTIEELPIRLEARLDELKRAKANLSEPELAIISESARALEAIDINSNKYPKVVANNMDVMNRNKRR